MAFCLVLRGQTWLPKRGKRHGSGDTVGAMVAAPVEHICPGLHPAGVGALRPRGHGHGIVLGGAYHHPDPDCLGPGVALAGSGAFCRVWRLGPRGSRAPNPSRERTGTTRAMGRLSPGRRRRYHVAPHQQERTGCLSRPRVERPQSEPGGDREGAPLGRDGGPGAGPGSMDAGAGSRTNSCGAIGR
jgi:hypothetical protein